MVLIQEWYTFIYFLMTKHILGKIGKEIKKNKIYRSIPLKSRRSKFNVQEEIEGANIKRD
jgi:hypothetical protein